MIEVIGRTPDEHKTRVLTIDRRGARVSLWIHPPRANDQEGWELIIPAKDLLTALVAEGVVSEANESLGDESLHDQLSAARVAASRTVI